MKVIKFHWQGNTPVTTRDDGKWVGEVTTGITGKKLWIDWTKVDLSADRPVFPKTFSTSMKGEIISEEVRVELGCLRPAHKTYYLSAKERDKALQKYKDLKNKVPFDLTDYVGKV